MQGKKRNRRAGFTLIEILLVITLISLILGISAALFANRLSGARQKAVAGEITATLRYARHLALARNERQAVLFDLDAGNYGIQGRPAKTIPEKIKLEIYESDIKAEPVVRGHYSIFYDAAGSSSWTRIMVLREERVIQIKADPIQTAYITNGNENEHNQ